MNNACWEIEGFTLSGQLGVKLATAFLCLSFLDPFRLMNISVWFYWFALVIGVDTWYIFHGYCLAIPSRKHCTYRDILHF